MKTVVWDVDDVLNNLMGEWFRRSWLAAHPECRLDYAKITANPPHEILGTTKDEYLRSLDHFRMNEFASLKPVPVFMDWFQAKGHLAHHVALTAVPLFAAPVSGGWVFSNFGNWIRSFNVVPSFRSGADLPFTSETKAEFLCHFGKVDVLIDDNSEVIESMRRLGIHAIQVPRPWNGLKGSEIDVLHELEDVLFS